MAICGCPNVVVASSRGPLRQRSSASACYFAMRIRQTEELKNSLHEECEENCAAKGGGNDANYVLLTFVDLLGPYLNGSKTRAQQNPENTPNFPNEALVTSKTGAGNSGARHALQLP